MLPLLHHHLRAIADGSVPAPVRAALRRRAEADARRNLRLAGELVRLLDLLARHGVTAVPYKGPLLAVRCYGDLALRPFRDLDFLVQHRDVDRAEHVLAAEGYRPLYGLTPEHEKACRAATCACAFSRNGDIVELHWAFGPRDFPLALEIDAVRTRLEPVAIGTTYPDTLCPEDLLLVLCAHGAKHLWERLEWICDVAELLRRVPISDGEGRLEQARALGAERMLLLGLRLAADLLDAPLPERLQQHVAADTVVVALAQQVRERLFRHTPGALPDPWELRGFHFRVRERWSDRWRSAVRVAFTPTPADWAFVTLPRPLSILYCGLRPLRLALKTAGALARWARPLHRWRSRHHMPARVG